MNTTCLNICKRPVSPDQQQRCGVSSYAVTENTGVLSGSPSASQHGRQRRRCEFTSGSSPDNNLHYIIAQGKHRKEKGEILQGALIDRRATRSCILLYDAEDRDDFKHSMSSSVMTASSTWYICRRRPQRRLPIQIHHRPGRPQGRPTAIPLSSLPEGDLRNIAGPLISTAGFCLPVPFAKKKTGFTAIMSGSFDPITKKLGALSQNRNHSLADQSAGFCQGPHQKRSAYGHQPESKPLICRMAPGPRLEDNSDKVYQSYYPAFNNPVPYSPVMGSFGNVANASNHNIGMTPSYSIVYQKRGNNYIVKLDQNNIPLWINSCPRTRASPISRWPWVPPVWPTTGATSIYSSMTIRKY